MGIPIDFGVLHSWWSLIVDSPHRFVRISIIFFLLACLFLSTAHTLEGQCTPAPSTGGVTFAYGVTDSVTPLQFVPQPFIVCDNASLYYYGNNPDTVYLEGSARLIVAFSQNIVVYMRNNSQLRIDTSSSGLKHFGKIIYDPTFTTFVDTANIIVTNGLVSCPGMSYSYAAFPNGNSPCAAPLAFDVELTSSRMEVWPQPASDELNILLPADFRGFTTLAIHALDGREVYRESQNGLSAKLNVSHLSKGLYLLTARSTFKTGMIKVAIH